MQILRSVVFHIFITFWTIFIFTFLSPLLLTFNPKAVTIIGLVWAKVVLLALKIICKLSYEVRGKENLPQAPYIITSKHQSTWETVFLTAYFKDAKYILKKELTRIPFYGWYLLASGMIYIDRSLGFSAIKKIVKDTTISLKKDNIIIIFPEGTRVAPGESKEIQPGVAAIHKHNKHIPIVPVALNSGMFWPKGLKVIKPGKIIISFLPPLNEELEKGELLKKLKENIDLESNLLANSK